MGVGGLPTIPEGEGVAPTTDRDRSVRPISEYDRTDHALSSEPSGEMVVAELEKMRQPRPISAIDRSDQFFFGSAREGRGATCFLKAGAIGGSLLECLMVKRIFSQTGITGTKIFYWNNWFPAGDSTAKKIPGFVLERGPALKVPKSIAPDNRIIVTNQTIRHTRITGISGTF